MRSNSILFPCNNVHASLYYYSVLVLFCLLWEPIVFTTREPWLGMRGGMESYQWGGLEHQNQSLMDTWHAQGEFGEEQFDREQMPRVSEKEDCCSLLGPGEPPSRVPWLQRQGCDGTSTLGLESFLGLLFLNSLGKFSIIVSINVPDTGISVLYALIC